MLREQHHAPFEHRVIQPLGCHQQHTCLSSKDSKQTSKAFSLRAGL